MKIYPLNNRLAAKFGLVTVAVFAFGAVGWFSLRLTMRGLKTFLTPSDVSVVCHNVYSSALVHDIETFVHSYAQQDGWYFNLAGFAKSLEEKFPIAKEVRVNRGASGGATVSVIGSLPKFLINDSLVLGDTQRFYAKKWFADLNYASLRPISLSGEYCSERCSDHLYQFLQKVPEDIWSRYTVTYQKPTYIKLCGTHQRQDITLLLDEESLFDDRKFEALPRMIHHRQSTMRKGLRLRKMVFDLRFANRVIAGGEVARKGRQHAA